MQFFSQNDPRWKKEKIGNSKLLLGDYGCTTCCIADASSFFKELKTPLEIAQSDMYTTSGLVLWQKIGRVFKTFEFETRFYTYNKKLINDAFLHPRKVVLLNVNYGKHWVFLVGSSLLAGYKCSDPYPYPAVMKRYSNIVGGAILRLK